MTQSIYEKNKKALEKTQPSIIPILEKINLDNQDECVVINGVDDFNVLKVKNDEGNYILYNSFYDPYKEAKEITKNIDYTVNRGLIFSIGVGMGYHLLEILENLNEKSILLAIERSDILIKNLLVNVDLSDYIDDKKIFFMLTKSEDEITYYVRDFLTRFFVNIMGIQTQILPITDTTYIKFCRTIVDNISAIKKNLIFALGNDIDDTLIGIDNRIKNMPHIIKNPGLKDFLNRYKDRYEGKPAIIVASGPSLDKNIHLLKEAKGKALLLSCDGSMESLKKYEIIPDVVSSVERIYRTYEAFYEDKTMPCDTVLTAPAVIRPEIFKTFKTKTLSLFKDEAIGKLFNEMAYDKGVVWSGLSVAHQLMGLAVLLGSDPIILVGQDLAYSPEGVSHTSEASVNKKVNVDEIDFFVKDINGNDIPTTFIWKQFLEIYEYGIEAFGINCIDATEGGARIKGTNIMTLKEAINQYCAEDIPGFRDLVDSIELDDDYMYKAFSNTLKQIIKYAKRLHVLDRRCIKALELNSYSKELLSIGINTQEELDTVYDALDYVEYKIVRKTMKIPEIMMVFQYPIMKIVNKINAVGTEITFEALSKNLELQKELLDIVRHYNKKTLTILKNGFELVKNEAMESASNSKLDQIMYPKYLDNFLKEEDFNGESS